MPMKAERKSRGGGGGGGGGDMEKWVKHYSSKHHILLVGEGDFSFSVSLAASFGSAHKMVASSLDAYDVLIKKYKKAISNLASLGNLGATILYEVDATKMKNHKKLSMSKFDRIIFNFPHAGFHGKEDDKQMIGMHRGLVEGFFRNAKDMLQAKGEIHVTHKTRSPFLNWDIPGLARGNGLAPIEFADFKIEDYPGYNNKKGDGNNSDEPFPLGRCCTFKFMLFPSVKMIPRGADCYAFTDKTSLQHQHNAIQVRQPNPSDYGHWQARSTSNTDYIPEHRLFPSTICVSRNSLNGLEGHHAFEKYEAALNGLNCPSHKVQWHEPERFMMEAPGRSQKLLADPTKLQHLTFYQCHRPSFGTEVYDCQGRVGPPMAMNVTSRDVGEYFGNLNNGLGTQSRAVIQLDEPVGKTRTRKQRMAEASGSTSSDSPYISHKRQRILLSQYGQHQETCAF